MLFVRFHSREENRLRLLDQKVSLKSYRPPPYSSPWATSVMESVMESFSAELIDQLAIRLEVGHAAGCSWSLGPPKSEAHDVQRGRLKVDGTSRRAHVERTLFNDLHVEKLKALADPVCVRFARSNRHFGFTLRRKKFLLKTRTISARLLPPHLSVVSLIERFY